MSRYIVRRLLVALPALMAVVAVVTGLLLLEDGETTLRHIFHCSGYYTAEDVAAVREELRLDMSFPERYASWLGDALQGDLGTSLWTGRGVTEAVAAHARVSISLVLIALPVALSMTAARGLLAALRPGSRLERWSAWISRIGAATPEFVIAIVGAYVLYALAGWAPLDGVLAAPEWPIAALVVGGVAAGWYVGARSAIDASPARRDGQDHGYVLAAQATGLGDASIATRHVLPNVTVSTLRVVAGALPLLLGSVLMVEVALGLPGVGLLVLESAYLRDYPVVEGVLFVTAVTVIASRLVVDVASAAMDPRIRNDEGDARPRYTL